MWHAVDMTEHTKINKILYIYIQIQRERDKEREIERD